MPNAQRITVGILEDHVALREGLVMLLDQMGFSPWAATGSVREAEALLRARRPDVCLIDIGLPESSGIEVTERLLALDPELQILLYTGTQDGDVLSQAADCGARGFALKAGAPEGLANAIRKVSLGESYVDPALQAIFLRRSTTERIALLSPRERDVLDLLAQGLSGAQTAAALSISPETVRTHIRNAMQRLEARTRVHAVAIALRTDEISWEP